MGRPRYVAGVDLGGTNLRVALANLDGLIVARWIASTVGIRDPARVVSLICEGVNALLIEGSVSLSALAAIGVGAPGVTDVDKGVVVATSYLMGWRDVPLRELLESALGVPAVVDNDVNLAAIGEGMAGVAQGVDNFVFLAIGTGIGAGIVLGGKIVRGNSWTAGELGYMLVPGVSEHPSSDTDPGALEAVAGGEGIRQSWHDWWSVEATSLQRDAVASEIFAAAESGDLLAKEVLGRSAKILSYAIYNLWLVLNCELIVLGGSVGLHRALLDATRRWIEKRLGPGRLSIVHSVLGSEAQLTGAIGLAIELAKSKCG